MRKSKIILEICVDSVESAIAAQRGGADRIELCSALLVGGLSPDSALYHNVRRHTDLPVRVLLRPRAGDFCYTGYEFDILCDEVRLFRELEADAVVIGCLTPDGQIDMERMEKLCDLAGGMDITFHRAFDMVRNADEALEQIKRLGISTVLTSGLSADVEKGKDTIHSLIESAGDKVMIMPGAGVTEKNIGRLAEELPTGAFHMSAKTLIDGSMKYRNPDVSMGNGDISEFTLWRADEEKIRMARRALDKKG